MQARDPYQRGGGGFSVPMLAFCAAICTAVILWLSDWTVQQVDCSAWSSFLDRRHQHAHVQQMLSEASALPGARAAASAQAAATAEPRLPLATASALGAVAADAMRRVGWPAGVTFASFGETA
jgi:type II secretory pathway component PulM